MDWKYKFAKLTSILLIGVSAYQIIYSAILLVFVYPHLKFATGESGVLLYESLIEKALVFYISLVISGIYGIGLLFRPKEQLTYLQIIGGLVIFLLTVFFVTKSEIVADPILESLLRSIGR